MVSDNCKETIVPISINQGIDAPHETDILVITIRAMITARHQLLNGSNTIKLYVVIYRSIGRIDAGID
jgi:homoserine acetyltransferase